ncbi:MAG: hypothetical protein Q8K93_33855 [Reyranella sp.]|uniref:hypothetical protein n=1 Tax=Reyranella sp. TaxID=1929291 RepID=UPI00272F5877|nr:hypothetical protein [Reyranella sp.]MDP1967185.1 hypothetical protein [Reyranella sp.]MDP2373793.1 hypothetical protein [Reyranella sp.]
MRGIWAGLGAALMVVGLAATAWAQDGLQRFEKELKPQLELKSFTYKTGTAVGTSGFVLTDVVAVVPADPATGDKESTVRIERIAVDALDFDRLKKDAKDDEAPRFAKLKIEGMTGDDEMFKTLAGYGIPKVPVDITLDYEIDGKDKVLTLRTLELNLRGQSKITVALVVDGISDKSSAMDDGKLRTASLAIDDTGLIAQVLPAMAKEEKTEPQEIADTALMMLAGFATEQGAPTLKALDAVASFIADWKAPKGPLALGLKPTETAGLDDIDKIMKPNALVELFGFSATYPGTKPGAAKAGPGK